MFHLSRKDPYDLTGLIQAVHNTHLMSRTTNSFIFARILLPSNNSVIHFKYTWNTYQGKSHVRSQKRITKKKNVKFSTVMQVEIGEAYVWEKVMYKLKVFILEDSIFISH